MERFATDFNVVKHSNLEYPLDYFSLTSLSSGIVVITTLASMQPIRHKEASVIKHIYLFLRIRCLSLAYLAKIKKAKNTGITIRHDIRVFRLLFIIVAKAFFFLKLFVETSATASLFLG